jgi:transcriptional regulator with XRE-family HTH domain
MGLQKGQLAIRAGLSRTTVSEALNGRGVPSRETVTGLARAIDLDAGPLLALHKAAVGPVTSSSSALGRGIGEYDPHDLEVHPAADPPERPGATGPLPQREAARLPRYVRRAHDDELDRAVQAVAGGRSRMVVLVGSSSTGKTRACWEAVQRLAPQGWRLWQPTDPTDTEEVLADLDCVVPRTVVWLNEAQHFLDSEGGRGNRVAAALHALLTDPDRRPVLVLGTLWDRYARTYNMPPRPEQKDVHARVRVLLEGREIPVPSAFDQAALDEAKALAKAGDAQHAHALEHTTDGRLAQTFAGAPELVRRYQTASPGARALLEAAMDARRLGVGVHLPLDFLDEAAEDYLTNDELDALGDDWVAQGLEEAGNPVYGDLAPLRRVRLRRSRDTRDVVDAVGPVYRLADYLEQHGAYERWMWRPPASFWRAAHRHLTDSDDLVRLSNAASDCCRLYWAEQLALRAAEVGDTRALGRLALMRERAGDGGGADQLALRAAEAGDTRALRDLALMRDEVGGRDEAERVLWWAVDAGDTEALWDLAGKRGEAGDWDAVERLLWRAVDAGDTRVLRELALMRERAGDRDEAERLLWRAVDAGDTQSLWDLVRLREEAGDRDGAERLALRGIDAGDTSALRALALLRDRAGGRDGAEQLYRKAIDAGDTRALRDLALMREMAGDRDGAERLALRGIDAGDTSALWELAQMREMAGDRDGAERLALRGIDAGYAGTLWDLALMREMAGDRDGAEQLCRKAVDAGYTSALRYLAQMRASVYAELAYQSAIAGKTIPTMWNHALPWVRWRPSGLDPDGTPSELS